MIYLFGDYTLNHERYELRYHDQRIPLEPQVFEVLAYLVQHADRVVSKHELFEHLWPQRYVSDKTLVRCIQKARQAINDRNGKPQLIQTIYGRGYRFAGAVRTYVQHPAADDTLLVSLSSVAPVQAPEHLTISPVASPQARPSRGGVPDAERKHVTVVTGGIENAAEFATGLGDETMHRVMQELLGLAQRTVQRYAGTLTECRGNGFTALFGAPVAYEDHARRAVRTALELVQCLQAHPTLLALPLPTRPRVRLGLHTGWVVVGPLGEEHQTSYVAVNSVTQLADHLQQCAGPGVILVSEATARLVQGEVHLEPWEHVQAGLQADVGHAYRVLAVRPRSWPWIEAGGYAHRHFVGRSRELTLLHERLERVAGSEGQAVSVVGEPGLGKSRLLYEFLQRIEDTRVTYLVGRCLSYGRTTPYLPILDLLRQHCEVTEADPPETITDKLRQRLHAIQIDPDTWAPYLLHVLGVKVGTECLADLSPAMRKARTFEALWQLFLASSHVQPLILAIEDLQWIDATSEACLACLVERLAGASLLCLCTYRPGYTPPWLQCSFATQLALTRLMPRDSVRVLQAVPGAQQLPDAVAQMILAKANGNPFFVEELSRAVIEQDQQQAPFVLPDTIQAVLAARIDRLPPEAKGLLQAAAVIGREVPYALLQAITDWPPEIFEQGLRASQAGELLYETHLFPERVYTFKHALTQEVAYQSLLHSTRQRYHARVAQVLVARFPETVETRPELVAHHYTEAGLGAQAVPYWQQAGQRTVERSANLEAVSHLTRVLELLTALPDTPARTHQELVLQTTLGQALNATRGVASPDVERAYSRARMLCQQVEETSRLFPVLIGLRGFYEVRGELQVARELGEQLLTLAQGAADPARLLPAHRAHGSTLLYLGEFLQAQRHLAQGLALYDPLQHHAIALRYQSQNPRVNCLRLMAITLWYLGYPDQALQRSGEACTLAQELSHPYSLAYALSYAGWLHILRREVQAAQERTEATLVLARQHGFALLVATGTFRRGWVLAAQGQHAEGLAQMRQGMTAYQAGGAEVARPYQLAQLAEAYGTAGQTEEGLRTVAEALTAVRAKGIRFNEAELYRLQGELVLQQARPDEDQAEACFRQALDVAHRQQAKSLELRTAVSVSRLWRRQGKSTAARQLLGECYSWFTEGFDTPDLREAKALLDAWA